MDDPTISLHKTSQLVSASYSMVRNVVRRRLNLKQYKFKHTFWIQKTDCEKRLKFSRWMLNSRIDYKIFFICTDESYFHLIGGHNDQIINQHSKSSNLGTISAKLCYKEASA